MWDSIGVSTFRTREMPSGWVPPLLRGWVSSKPVLPPDFPIFPIITVSASYGDHDVTQPLQRFTCVHPSDVSLARSPHSARSFLGPYPSLSTPPLPVTQRGIGNRRWTLA